MSGFFSNRRSGVLNSRQFDDEARKIWMRFWDPVLRMPDLPGSELLVTTRLMCPADPHLAELDACVTQQQIAKAVISGDPFWPSYPPAGSLPPLAHGRIPLAALPTEDVLSVHVSDLKRNVCVVGPTGSGKTNWLRLLIATFLEAM